jgi:hypothetical protein
MSCGVRIVNVVASSWHTRVLVPLVQVNLMLQSDETANLLHNLPGFCWLESRCHHVISQLTCCGCQTLNMGISCRALQKYCPWHLFHQYDFMTSWCSLARPLAHQPVQHVHCMVCTCTTHGRTDISDDCRCKCKWLRNLHLIVYMHAVLACASGVQEKYHTVVLVTCCATGS